VLVRGVLFPAILAARKSDLQLLKKVPFGQLFPALMAPLLKFFLGDSEKIVDLGPRHIKVKASDDLIY
jgi:hypothetical protein